MRLLRLSTRRTMVWIGSSSLSRVLPPMSSPGTRMELGVGAEREKLKSEIGLSKARKQAAEVAFLDQLKGEDRVLVDVSNLYIFFLRNGTPRLFSPSPSLTNARDGRDGHYGIQESEGWTGLRSTDPSKAEEYTYAHETIERCVFAPARHLGLRSVVSTCHDHRARCSICWTVVDKGLEVVDRYHDRILKLERQTLIHAKMTIVRERAYSYSPIPLSLSLSATFLLIATLRHSPRSERRSNTA